MFDYTIRRSEVYQPLMSSTESCELVIAQVEAAVGLTVPCYSVSTVSDHKFFFRYFRQGFLQLLLSRYQFLAPLSLGAVVDKVTELVELANATHHCPRRHRVRYRTIHAIDVHIHRRDTEEERVIRESFNAAVAVTKSATHESVEGLFRARSRESESEGDRFEIGWTDVDRDCVICMDQIATRGRSLTMPCAHVFHDDCLVQWLNNSRVCPLCRYEMPDHDSDSSNNNNN